MEPIGKLIDIFILESCNIDVNTDNICRPSFQQCLQHRDLYHTLFKISKGAKIRNRYNQVPHLTQDTNGKVVLDGLGYKETRGLSLSKYLCSK